MTSVVIILLLMGNAFWCYLWNRAEKERQYLRRCYVELLGEKQ